VGGGAAPEHHLKSLGITFEPGLGAERLMAAFRTSTPPIIGRIDSDRFILDLKAVDVEDLPHLTRAVKHALK
jgi:L-seryl-tRNA(Ser) seleniumtransferase